jgi:hypothetical protein
MNIKHNLTFDLEHLKNNDAEGCPRYPVAFTFPDDRLKGRITGATLFINGNFHMARREVIRILNKIYFQGRGTHVVTGAGEKALNKLPFPVKSVTWLAKHSSFDLDYDSVKTKEFLATTKFAR